MVKSLEKIMYGSFKSKAKTTGDNIYCKLENMLFVLPRFI